MHEVARRWLIGGVLAGTLLAAFWTGAAGEELGRARPPSLAPPAGRPVLGPGRSRAHPADVRAAQRGRLRVFYETRRLEARDGVRRRLRDVGRAAEQRRLESAGAAADWQGFASRIRRHEQLDDLRARQDWSEHEARRRADRDWTELERWTGRRLGPVTRRVLEKSRVQLRILQRRLEVEETLAPLGRSPGEQAHDGPLGTRRRP